MTIDRNLRQLARTFFLVAAILGTICTFGIGAIWLWPMYSIYKKAETDNEEHIALGVCSIIFAGVFGIVAGIMIIISTNTNQTTNKRRS